MSKKKDLSYYLSLGYPYELSDWDGDGYFSSHPDLPGCMSSGASAAEAIENLDAARELWIETRLEDGYNIPEPVGGDYSGRVSLRMTPSLHAQLAKISRREKMSLNALLNQALASFAGAWAEPMAGLAAGIEEIKAGIEEIKETSASLVFSRTPSVTSTLTTEVAWPPQEDSASALAPMSTEPTTST